MEVITFQLFRNNIQQEITKNPYGEKLTYFAVASNFWAEAKLFNYLLLDLLQ